MLMDTIAERAWYWPPACRAGSYGDFLSWYYNFLVCIAVLVMIINPVLGNGFYLDFGFIIYLILAGKMKKRSQGSRRFVLVLGWISVIVIGVIIGFALFDPSSLKYPGKDSNDRLLQIAGFVLSIVSAALSIVPFVILGSKAAKREFEEYTAENGDSEVGSTDERHSNPPN